jgi:hypothetical protein
MLGLVAMRRLSGLAVRELSDAISVPLVSGLVPDCHGAHLVWYLIVFQ